MLQYVIKRLLSTIPVLIGISLLLFFMLRMLPGDPAQVLAGQMATPEEVENIRNNYPQEIVELFEKHGFIWGGKWSHFDLMHFEYRPEMVKKGQLSRGAGSGG